MSRFLNVALVLMVSAVTAFQSSPRAARTVARPTVTMAEKSPSLPFLPMPKNLDGYVGNVGFDPLGVAEWGIPIEYLRESELKHGRVCMLAWIGFVAVDNGFILPNQAHVSSVAAHDVAVKGGAMTALGIAVFLFEAAGWFGIQEMLGGSGREPGDFGFDPLKLNENAEKKASMQLKEITHCRLAMFAFSGVVTQAVLADKGFPYY